MTVYRWILQIIVYVVVASLFIELVSYLAKR